jgi:glycosyltransferase involved in cell wall biosynthesis
MIYAAQSYSSGNTGSDTLLSLIVPCYNEELTLFMCVERIIALKQQGINIECIIVDDCSRDKSREIATSLAERFTEVQVVVHENNEEKERRYAQDY